MAKRCTCKPMDRTFNPVRITDVVGRTIFQQTYNVQLDAASITLSQKPVSGLYFVQVIISGETITEKWLVH